MAVAAKYLGPDGTLAALPEGAMVNYLIRARNPTPLIVFMPPEVIHWGEHQMIEAFARNRPDVVLLIHKDTDFYGVGRFGTGYAKDLVEWIREYYGIVARFGDEPFSAGARFGVDVMVSLESGAS